MLLYKLICDICGKPAMYTTRLLSPYTEKLTADVVVKLDGSRPVDLVDLVVCGSCGNMSPSLHYDVYEPAEIEFDKTSV